MEETSLSLTDFQMGFCFDCSWNHNPALIPVLATVASLVGCPPVYSEEMVFLGRSPRGVGRHKGRLFPDAQTGSLCGSFKVLV